MASDLFKVALSALLLFTLVDGDDTCTPDASNPCVCKGSGFTIDLSKKLSFPTTIGGDGDFTYKVDLCKGVPCHGESKSDIGCGCQIGGEQNKKPYNFNIGKLSTAEWTISSRSPLAFKIKYTDGDRSEPSGKGGDEIPRTAIFEFTEKKSLKKSTIKFEDDDGSTLTYTFDIDIGTAKGGSGSKVGVIGLVLILLILLAVVTYLVVGSVYMYKFRGARGAEVVPNWLFWKEIPFVVKDGCVFTFGPCIRKIRGGEYSYEKI